MIKQPYPLRRKIELTDGSEADELVVLDKDGVELLKSNPIHSEKEVTLQYEHLIFVSKPNEPIYVIWDSVVKQVNS